MAGPWKGQPAEGTACICGCTDVRPRAVLGSPAEDVYLSSGLYCIYTNITKVEGPFIHNYPLYIDYSTHNK